MFVPVGLLKFCPMYDSNQASEPRRLDATVSFSKPHIGAPTAGFFFFKVGGMQESTISSLI